MDELISEISRVERLAKMLRSAESVEAQNKELRDELKREKDKVSSLLSMIPVDVGQMDDAMTFSVRIGVSMEIQEDFMTQGVQKRREVLLTIYKDLSDRLLHQIGTGLISPGATRYPIPGRPKLGP